MPVREGSASWKGGVKKGKGTIKVGRGGANRSFDAASRFGEGRGTNPEELIGAAHAGCFSMAFASILARAGFAASRISTMGKVNLEQEDEGFRISSVVLECEAVIPGISRADFERLATEAKETCPVSRALAGTKIHMKIRLV